MLTALPLILAALFFFGFSGFMVKNWMQSLHICRTNLIDTQKNVATDLDTLMSFNSLAKALRAALIVAKVNLAMATATYNPPAIAKAMLEIQKIQARQRSLDKLQKSLILSANSKMQSGIFKVYRELRKQSASLQPRLPNFLRYQIKPNLPRPALLAVKADRPGPAPVYVLKERFSHSQALSVNWISHFSSGNGEKMSWLKNKHSKRDYCSISLEEKNRSYSPKMMADRF